jgi:hypothetical protein
VKVRSAQRFYSECFKPAQSKYINTQRSDISASGQAIIATTNTTYGSTDTGWMGSQLFRTEPGFYADMRAANPVPGFPVNFARDGDYYNPSAGVPPPYEGYMNPDWGRPTCKEWWEDSAGVREAMIAQSSNWQALYTRATMLFSTTDRAKDEVAQVAEHLANPAFVDTTRAMGFDASLPQNVGGAMSTIGVFLTQLFSYVTINPLLNGLLMMQAIILMGMYMFLPLITFLSGYNLKVMLYGAVGIFTVKFWAILWSFTVWMDAHLVNAMYPGGSFKLTDFIRSAGNDYKLTLMAMLMMTMFIGLPIIWTGMMSWIGIRMSGTFDGMMNSTTKTVDNAGRKSIGR